MIRALALALASIVVGGCAVGEHRSTSGAGANRPAAVTLRSARGVPKTRSSPPELITLEIGGMTCQGLRGQGPAPARPRAGRLPGRCEPGGSTRTDPRGPDRGRHRAHPRRAPGRLGVPRYRPPPMRRSGPLLAVVLMLALVGGPARAHIVSDREIVILRGLPAGLLAGMSERPDSLGYVGANHGGWQHVEHQSSGLVGLMDACARADSTGAEAAWSVIDAAMRHQRPSGDYDAAGAETRARQLERTGWWIAQLCRAEVAVMNSPLQDRFRWRVALLLPKLRRSVDWLVAAGEELFTLHEGRADL